jgi:hypothetical protein
MPGAIKTHVFEREGRVYLVGGLTPTTPAKPEEFAFGSSIVDTMRRESPNENLAWFQGQYVEADRPNLNGAMWTADELAVKTLTPRLMPVTIMHDPSTAVGMIADVRLLTPEADGVPRARIETALAIWKHRFPEAHHEAMTNYAAGTLAQSMECLAPEYACSTCSQLFHKMPDASEEAHWCEHLASGTAARVLKNVTFSGVGLIYGSRGASPADPNASLDAIADEVAHFHEQARHTQRPGRKPSPTKDPHLMEIKDEEFARLTAEAARAKALETEKAQAVKDQEAAEAEATREKKRADDAEAETKRLKEEASKGVMADERLGALGAGFLAALGEKTKARVKSQAADLSDDDWKARLDELEELTKVKRDATADGSEGDGEAAGAEQRREGGEFTPEEQARHRGQPGRGPARQPTAGERRSIVAAL